MLDHGLRQLQQIYRLKRSVVLRAFLSAFMVLAASGGIASLARGCEAQLAEQELEEEADESWTSSSCRGGVRSGGRQSISYVLPVSALSRAAKIFGTSPFAPTGHFLTSELRAPLRC